MLAWDQGDEVKQNYSSYTFPVAELGFLVHQSAGIPQLNSEDLIEVFLTMDSC